MSPRRLLTNTLASGDMENLLKQSFILAHPGCSETIRETLGTSRFLLCVSTKVRVLQNVSEDRHWDRSHLERERRELFSQRVFESGCHSESHSFLEFLVLRCCNLNLRWSSHWLVKVLNLMSFFFFYLVPWQVSNIILIPRVLDYQWLSVTNTTRTDLTKLYKNTAGRIWLTKTKPVASGSGWKRRDIATHLQRSIEK